MSKITNKDLKTKLEEIANRLNIKALSIRQYLSNYKININLDIETIILKIKTAKINSKNKLSRGVGLTLSKYFKVTTVTISFYLRKYKIDKTLSLENIINLIELGKKNDKIKILNKPKKRKTYNEYKALSLETYEASNRASSLRYYHKNKQLKRDNILI